MYICLPATDFKAWVTVKAKEQSQPGLNFSFSFLPVVFILTPYSMYCGLNCSCSDAQTVSYSAWWRIYSGVDSLTQFPPRPLEPLLWASGADTGCWWVWERAWRMTSPKPWPNGMSMSPSSSHARLRPGSFLAGFFHVYSSYRTTSIKRELQKWFLRGRARMQPIVKAALYTAGPRSVFF